MDSRDSVKFIELCENGQLEEIKKIIEKLPRSDIMDCYGTTPLTGAIIHNQIQIVKYLIEAGFDIDEKGADGYTPLTEACHLNYTSIVKYLLGKGADKELTNDHGEKAIDIAIKNGNTEIIELLK
jgi:ankyrin repeat protein